MLLGACRDVELKVLSEEIRQPYFLKLTRFLWEKGVQGATEQSVGSSLVCSSHLSFHVKHMLKEHLAAKDIYNWSRVTPLGRLRVVIIVQDPYHRPGQAHSLFLCSEGRCPSLISENVSRILPRGHPKRLD